MWNNVTCGNILPTGRRKTVAIIWEIPHTAGKILSFQLEVLSEDKKVPIADSTQVQIRRIDQRLFFIDFCVSCASCIACYTFDKGLFLPSNFLWHFPNMLFTMLCYKSETERHACWTITSLSHSYEHDLILSISSSRHTHSTSDTCSPLQNTSKTRSLRSVLIKYICVSEWRMLTINYRIAHAVVTPRPLTSQEEKVCVCERPRRRGSFSNPANTERGLLAIESSVTDKLCNK